MTYVLDASALLRYLDREPGADRVRDLIKSHVAAKNQIAISAIQWGEVACVLFKRHGHSRAVHGLARLERLQFDVVAATAERAQRAALIKMQRKISYADAFAVELASDSQNHLLVTADFDFKLVENDIMIEFLPSNESGGLKD